MKQMLLRQQTSVVSVIAHSPGVIAPHGARLAREETTMQERHDHPKL